MPTAAEVGREDVAQPTMSTPRPPMAVPAYQPSQGKGMICLKCGVVGHGAAECTYIDACRRGLLGRMERVCKENPDSIMRWQQLHAYALAMSSQGLVHMTAPASQLRPTWTPPLGSMWQATPSVPTPSPGPAAPAPPHTGVAASSSPAQSGVYATPTAASLGKPDVVTQPTSSAPRPPTEPLAYQPVVGQYHQVGTSQLLPTWTLLPGYFWRPAPVVPSLRPAPLAAPVPPQAGVAASPRPAHSRFFPMPFPFGRPW